MFFTGSLTLTWKELRHQQLNFNFLKYIFYPLIMPFKPKIMSIIKMATESEDNPSSCSNGPLTFMEDFVCKSLRMPLSKWTRMMSIDSQKTLISGFIERCTGPQVNCKI